MKLARKFSIVLITALCLGNVSVYAQSDNSMAVQRSVENADRFEIPGTISEEKAYDETFLSVTGFAQGQVNDRRQYINTEYYREVSNEREFLEAVLEAKSGKVKVIEIKEDLNLGWKYLNLSSEEKSRYNFISNYSNFSKITNPDIAEYGVTKFKLGGIQGLTMFSQNGSRIDHTEFQLQSGSTDLVVRNLTFGGMWQWDDTGKHKEVGWSSMKINGAKNVWVDHCSFENAADGMVDLENGAEGITMSWCKFGAEADENPSSDSAIYKSVQFMEERYQNGELAADGTSRYYNLRSNGATAGQIMAYAAYHSKVNLIGSGDKDYVDYVYSNGTVVPDSNSRLQLTVAYSHYMNVGQRVPMIRQGVGHLFNCYIDDEKHMDIHLNNETFNTYGMYPLSRCINARNGASIAADTCVFNGVEEAIIGSERQGRDTANMNEPWDSLFQNAQNHSLIVNSRITNSKGSYEGSSWDNDGENLFTAGFDWDDKSTIGNWTWKSSIVGIENMSKDNPPAEPFEFTYDYNAQLPYEYSVMPLDDVEYVVSQESGAGAVSLTPEEWLQIEYTLEDGSEDDSDDETKEESAVSLTVPEEVKAGETFEVVVGLENSKADIYSQDFTVAYDKTQMILVETEALNPSIIVATDEVEEGLRILTATEGGKAAEEGIVKLTFTAYEAEEEVQTVIGVTGVQFGVINEGTSSVEAAEDVKKEMTIKQEEVSKPVDKTALYAAIGEAESLSEKAVIGTEVGNYPQSAKDALDEAISTARAVAELSDDQEAVNNAVMALQEAVDSFKQSQIQQVVPSKAVEDINADGKVDVADLALAAYYYRVTSESENWEDAKAADINEDKEVNIVDLTLIARKILGK